MNSHFELENSHWQNAEGFKSSDPQLKKLLHTPYSYTSSLLSSLPNKPGIYTLTGSIRVGKTTLLKQWIKQLIEQKIAAHNIIYLSSKLISDYKELLQFALTYINNSETNYLLIDDISNISDWHKAIAELFTAGKLNNTVLMLSDTDINLARTVDIHFNDKNINIKAFNLLPLSFKETLEVKQIKKNHDLIEAFEQYLIHGGYIFAINELAKTGTISNATLNNYYDLLTSRIVRHGKNEQFLKEILSTIIKHYTLPITWNAVAGEITINHPKTISDYIALLESLNIVLVQSALLEDKLKPAPKKARKLMFVDPFIFNAVKTVLAPNNSNSDLKYFVSHPELSSRLVTSCVISHFKRHYPVYYIKGEGEIDLAYVYDQHFWPIVISWTNELNTKELKQLMKYNNSRILAKTDKSGVVNHIRIEAIPLVLSQL